MMWIRVAAAAVLFAGGTCAAIAPSAEADDEPIRTVYWKVELFTHGEPFEVECERGSYLVGFEGRAGDWIDHLRIVCARWNAARGKLERAVVLEEKQIGTSQGGGPTRAVCPTDSGIAGDYDEHYARDDDIYVLHTLEFYCVHATDGTRPRWREFGSTSPIGTGWAEPQPHAGCPEGYLATGIYGRSGQFIDKLFGFVCRPRPKASPVAGTKQNKEAEYKNPAIGGAKRLGNVRADGVQPYTPPPPPPSPATPAKPTATAKADVNIHQEASGLSPRIGIMREGRTVEVLGHDPEKDWYRLEFKGVPGVSDGPGWVAANWLTINP